MLNLNNIPEAPKSSSDFELIPDGTIARGIVTLSGGDTKLDEFGHGTFFKSSQTGAKWLPIEITIVGGSFDKRKVWHNIFVDGAKLNAQGVSIAKTIGLQTLKQMIDSAFNLASNDQSPQAQQARSLPGIEALNGLSVCFKIGVEKGTNGYEDRNKIKSVLTLGQNGYIPTGGAQAQAPVAQAPMAPQQPIAQPVPQAPVQQEQQAGVVPTWAQ